MITTTQRSDLPTVNISLWNQTFSPPAVMVELKFEGLQQQVNDIFSLNQFFNVYPYLRFSSDPQVLSYPLRELTLVGKMISFDSHEPEKPPTISTVLTKNIRVGVEQDPTSFSGLNLQDSFLYRIFLKRSMMCRSCQQQCCSRRYLLSVEVFEKGALLYSESSPEFNIISIESQPTKIEPVGLPRSSSNACRKSRRRKIPLPHEIPNFANREQNNSKKFWLRTVMHTGALVTTIDSLTKFS